MNLLPKSHSEFSSAEYWEKFFKRRGNKAFEWYGTYPELCGILHKYIKTTDKVLVVGCGNSQLSADMYDVGYQNIINIDISEVTIKQQIECNKERRPKMQFLQMDALKMEFADGDFNVVLDKGTLDALMTDDSAETNQRIDNMFAEIGRVLRQGGRYVCISLSQDHILKKVLNYFPQEGWMVRIHRVMEQEEQDEQKEFCMPVFVYIFTKFRKMPNMPSILEVAHFDDHVERCDSVDRVKTAVAGMQQYGLIRHQLKTKSHVGENISLDLFGSGSSSPRYTLHVVDMRKKSRNKFAVFIVPEGRETEWMFSTDEGRHELSQSAGFERLVVVSLHRGHTYDSLDTVKSELSGKVMELAPPGLGNVQVPFLSIGDDVGSRTIRFEGTSEYSGPYVIEDTESEGKLLRRLIFLNNKNTVQSETQLIREKTKKGNKKKNKLCVDVNQLCSKHHSVMVAGMALLQDFQTTMDKGIGILIVGLGGGCLPNFIQKNYRKVMTDVVEIDAAMVSVATDWFSFSQSDHMKVHVADGIKFIENMAANGEKKHIVMLDVDNKDTTVGMSSPPQIFLENCFLKHIHEVLLPTGLFVLNLACRNKSLREKVIQDLQEVFPTLYCKKLQSDLNEIIYALPSSRTEIFQLKDNKLSKQLQSSLRILHDVAKVESKGANIPDLTNLLENLEIL